MRLRLSLVSLLLVAACATAPRLSSEPTPAPQAHERVLAVPVDVTAAASIAALVRLGFVPAEVNGSKGTIVSHFRPVGDGGPIRLLILLATPAPGLTRVRVLSERLPPAMSPAETVGTLEKAFFAALVAEITRQEVPPSRFRSSLLEA